MTDQTISMDAHQVIDVAEFARLEKKVEGKVPAEELQRLRDLILAGKQTLSYEIRGSLSVRREPQIACIIQGSVSLECQRCLGAFDHPVDVHSTLVFVADESQLPAIDDEDDSIDYVVAESRLDLLALIEDEVILALALAPRHDEGKCNASAKQLLADQKPSPFAALSKLKRT